MKTKRKSMDAELYNIFIEVCCDEESCAEAVQDSIKAFSYVKQDVLYRQLSNMNDE